MTGYARGLGAAASLLVILISPIVCFPQALAASSRETAYTLEPGDRIGITVAGQPDMSGEMLIDGAGSISLPFAGALTVREMTVPECEQAIKAKLANGFLKDPLVSVRIVEPRPIYVMGDVRSPGVYPFRYGSTVRSAVALAGGYRVPDPTQVAPMVEYLLVDERVRQLSFQKRSLLIRQARLEAQRDGQRTFSPPAALQPTGPDIAGLVAAEKAVMESQASIMSMQLSLLNSQKQHLKDEIEATKSELATERSRLGIVSEEADQVSKLLKQGLGLRQTEVNLKLNQASQEANLWRLMAQLSRLQKDSGDLDIKMQDVDAASKRLIFSELREVKERLAELDVTLPSLQEMRDARLQQAAAQLGSDAARTVTVTRTHSRETSVEEGSETMLLEPGDVVDVHRPSADQALRQRLSLQ